MADLPHEIPRQLIEQLHAANDRLHQARLEWEKWLDAAEYRHQERVSAAQEKLDQAEHAVEEIERQVQAAQI